MAEPRPLPELMDCAAIMRELGVTEHTANRIMRWCFKRHTVRPVDGGRKLYVFREDVQAWLDESTRSAA